MLAVIELVAFAAGINYYLHSQKRQDIAREAGGRGKKLLYIACTSSTGHKNDF